MAKKIAARTAQGVLSADFVFNHKDWVIDSADGTKKTLGSTVALSVDPTEPALTGPVANTITFDAIPLPYGAVVVGGEVIEETAFAGCTAATILVGIAGTTGAYLGSTSIMQGANTRTPLLMTAALASNGGANVRLTIAYTVANATAGKVRVRIQYVMDGRGNEVSAA